MIKIPFALCFMDLVFSSIQNDWIYVEPAKMFVEFIGTTFFPSVLLLSISALDTRTQRERVRVRVSKNGQISMFYSWTKYWIVEPTRLNGHDIFLSSHYSYCGLNPTDELTNTNTIRKRWRQNRNKHRPPKEKRINLNNFFGFFFYFQSNCAEYWD